MPEDKNKLGVLVVLTIALLVGIPLLSSIADMINPRTNTYTVPNETITTGNEAYTTPALAQDDLVSFTSLTNVTGANIRGFCNVSLSLGTLSCNKTGANVTYAAYVYYPNEYVKDSISRVLINLLILFFAIAIIAAAILGMNKMGIFDQFK